MPSEDPLQNDQTMRELRARLAAGVRRICPGWLLPSADDIVQLAVMRVLRAAKAREGMQDLSALYLEKAAYCALIDEIRRHRRRREEQAGNEQLLRVASATHADPEASAEAGEITRALVHCLGGLAEARRQAVTLHLLGHTITETGVLLGWSAKRAENLVCRGLADLRLCLTAKGMAR